MTFFLKCNKGGTRPFQRVVFSRTREPTTASNIITPTWRYLLPSLLPANQPACVPACLHTTTSRANHLPPASRWRIDAVGLGYFAHNRRPKCVRFTLILTTITFGAASGACYVNLHLCAVIPPAPSRPLPRPPGSVPLSRLTRSPGSPPPSAAACLPSCQSQSQPAWPPSCSRGPLRG